MSSSSLEFYFLQKRCEESSVLRWSGPGSQLNPAFELHDDQHLMLLPPEIEPGMQQAMP